MTERANTSTSPEAERPGFALRMRMWRNKMVGSSDFRGRMLRFTATQWLARKKANALFRLISGFVFSQVLNACVRLGVLEELRNTCRTTDELASSCGLTPDRMRLLLEQAERIALVRKVGRESWQLDDNGAVVAGDPGLSAMIEHHTLFYQDLAQPDALLKSAEADTQLRRFWAYTQRDDPIDIDANAAQSFSKLMRTSQSMLADCILASHDFGRYQSILDIGGGEGAFVATLAETYPHLELHLFDLPPVIELTQIHLTGKGLAERTTLHRGDFAKDPIPNTADCVCLVRILCDHDDAKVRRILKNLHQSLPPGTRVMIAEAMAGDTEGARLAAVYFSFYFLAMGSGKCRSDKEIKALLDESGFRRPHTVATPNPLLATLVFAER